MHINSAWRRCADRFAEVELFVDQSSTIMTHGATSSFRSDLYGSWVLLAYSACQFSLEELGRGCLEFLGKKYRSPLAMPPSMLRHHQRMTLDHIRTLAESASSAVVVNQALKDMNSGDWALHTSLLRMERNVWPQYVKEWLRRLGVPDEIMKWMSEPVPGRTETYESRMASLVEERNPIAHGQSASNIVSSVLMKEWIADCRAFMENCAMTIALHLSREHLPRLKRLGTVDRRTKLGTKTIPLKELKFAVSVGDYLVLEAREVKRKVVRVESIMSDGCRYEKLAAGTTQVAVGLSRAHQNCDVFLTP